MRLSFSRPLYYYWYEVGMCDKESVGGDCTATAIGIGIQVRTSLSQTQQGFKTKAAVKARRGEKRRSNEIDVREDKRFPS